MATFVFILFIINFISLYSQEPCLGEYEYCSQYKVCAIDCSNDNPQKCSAGDYVCPISKKCVSGALGYLSCPQLKGTHLDWNLTLSERVNFLLKNLSIDEKWPQLTNRAPGISRLGIPFYNYRSNDIHSIAGVPHSTVFPNGCGLGATWSKQDLAKTGYTIAFEQRSLHNSFVHEGNRDPNDGGAITNNGPNLNLVRDPRWGRSQEVYSEDPRLTGHLGYELVNAMQNGGMQDNKYLLMGMQCKHYAVYNIESIPESRFYFNAITDAVNWGETYSPVFRECVVRAQATQVMCSYNSINGVPACGNNDTLNGVLRDQWGFEGYVVSDYDAMEQIYSTHHYANSSEQAVVIGLKAGDDMEGGGTTAINTIPQALKDGLLTENDINQAFARIIRVRVLTGLFDPPTLVDYNKWYNNSEVEGEANLNYSRLVAAKSICLYKNKNNILPMNKNNIKGIAMIGFQAVSGGVYTGNYCSYPDKGVKPLIQALRDEIEGITPHTNCTFETNIEYNQPNNLEVTAYSPEECCDLCFNDVNCKYWSFTNSQCWLKPNNQGRETASNHVSGNCLDKSIIDNSIIRNSYGCMSASCDNKNGFSDSLDLIKSMHSENKLSHVIIGLGLDQSIEREGHDRSTIELPGYQNDLVSEIYNYTSTINIPIVCYLIHGGTLALGNAYTKCDVILDAWYPGQMGGYGIADVLLGNYNPAGRASVTSYTGTNMLPNMGDMNEYPSDNKYGLTYRYFNKNDGILIPFGFGLSYTQFKYSDLTLNITKSSNSEYEYELNDICGIIKVSFNVTNIGDKYDGDEVAQLYVKQPNSNTKVPNIRLGDFERIELIKVGETRNVNLVLTPRYRSTIFNESSVNWYTPDIQIEKGVIELYIGGGQPDLPVKDYLMTKVMVMNSGSFYTCHNQD